VARALTKLGRLADLCFTTPERNSMGAALLGGGALEDAMAALHDGSADTVLVLENDLYRRAERSAADALFAAAKHVIALDQLRNATTSRADLLLPAATFAEDEGTLVNNEARAQRFYKVMVSMPPIQESWRWLAQIGAACGRERMREWSCLDDVSAAMAEDVEVLRPVLQIGPPASSRMGGRKIPRQPHRYSGRTAMHANLDVSEQQPPQDPNSPLAFSMEGYDGQPPPALTLRYWAPYWNSVQALNKFQEEVGGPLRGGDPGKRLIEAADESDAPYFDDVPKSSQPRPNEWLFVPLYHIFGSEELSVLSHGVAERSPRPYVAVGQEDADQLQLREGDQATVIIGTDAMRLPVKLISSLKRGLAGLPIGLGGMQVTKLPARGKIVRDAKE